MWRTLSVAGVFVVVVSCSPGNQASNATPPASVRPSTTPSALASPVSGARCTTVAASYGLMLSSGQLRFVGPDGCLGPATPVAAPSAHSCPGGVPAVVPPPVSASNSRVYFRNGDSDIWFVTPVGNNQDVTTVPGGPTTVSFFAVSPDDQRIAVVVEDLSGPSTIGLRLYVEDVVGHGHHADIYSTTISASGGLTLWPSGWQNNDLVLAVVTACSSTPVRHPVAWHLVDPATANRLVNIDTSVCLSTLIPSAGGIACATPNTGAAGAANGRIRIYNWSGSLIWDAVNSDTNMDQPAAVSPSGTRMFVNASTTWDFLVVQAVATNDLPLMKPPFACLWIDDATVMTSSTVVAFPTQKMQDVGFQGDCVGRFPGSL